MDQGQIAQGGFLETHKDLAKTVHPRMAGLHHPSAGSVAEIGTFFLAFFTAGTNMGCVATLFHSLTGILAVEGLVRTQVLWTLRCRLRPADDDAVKDMLRLGNVMPIGPCDHDRERGTAAIDQEVSFGSLFFPGPSGCARPTLVPEVPWS
jgi:hypothetical protein